MNGQYYLIKKIGTKYKFYWSPLSPSPKNQFSDWGVAVIDFSWLTVDPRSKHLQASPLNQSLKPLVQVLRDPTLADGENYRAMCLYSGPLQSCLRQMSSKHPYCSWAAG